MQFARGFGPIYLLNADGSGAHALPGTAPADEPVWSPDRRTIVFSRWGKGESRFFTATWASSPGVLDPYLRPGYSPSLIRSTRRFCARVLYTRRLTMLPARRRARQYWPNFLDRKNVPLRLVFMMSSHSDQATSTTGGQSFSAPVKVTSGNIRNNQDQRIVTAPNGDAYLTFDNGVQGGKGTVFYVSKSTNGGATWSTPIQFATLVNPVCVFPPSCFNISGGQFRAGGTYPSPAFDSSRNRLVVAYADIAPFYGQIYVTSASACDLTQWTAPQAIAAAPADQFSGELGVAPNGRYDVSFYDREYTSNLLVDLTYATSSDGGTTWSHFRVSKAGFDPSTWGVPSSSALGYRPFIGDYNGIVSTDAFAGMVWTGVAPPQPFNLEVYFSKATP